MFIEKNRRYFRRYNIRLKGRAKAAPSILLVGADDDYTFVHALRVAIKAKKNSSPQSNGDTVELVTVEHDAVKKVVVLLFHRGSPNAADPSYRKKLKDVVSVRQTVKEREEEQAVSCHLVVSTKKVGDHYPAVLEEIPGLSASAVLRVVTQALFDYKYTYELKGEAEETYTVFKAEGVKSEGLSGALKKKSALTYLTLLRSSAPDAPDSDGIAEPLAEKVRYRIVGNPKSAEWKARFKAFVSGAKADWDKVTVEIALDDERHRTVRVDQEDDAAEVLFVRSELVHFKTEVTTCSTTVTPTIVQAACKLLAKPQ